MGKKKKEDLSPEDLGAKENDQIEDLRDWVDDSEDESSTPAESETKLSELQQERDDLMDQLLRKQAEFDNYRKRVVREKSEARLSAQEELLKEILPILDSCEKGLESFESAEDSDDPRLEAFRHGYELLWKSLQALLARFDVTPVPGPGEPFDPTYHEAVLREETTEFEDGQVIDEFRRGYLLRGRLLRPSQVRVAVHSEEATPN